MDSGDGSQRGFLPKRSNETFPESLSIQHGSLRNNLSGRFLHPHLFTETQCRREIRGFVAAISNYSQRRYWETCFTVLRAILNQFGHGTLRLSPSICRDAWPGRRAHFHPLNSNSRASGSILPIIGQSRKNQIPNRSTTSSPSRGRHSIASGRNVLSATVLEISNF